MMLALKLAYRNLVGAGLRTWLNVFVLSFTYILIIWQYGMIDGWNYQAKIDMQNWEVGNGQYWQQNFDPYDFFSYEESHAQIPELLKKATSEGKVTPILISQGTIYPDGRLQSIILRGIRPDQKVIAIPSAELNVKSKEIPVIIGQRMANSCKLKQGDITTIRWRDANGTFDAEEVKIVKIFHCDVPSVDAGQMYLSLENHQKMMQTPGEATFFVIDKNCDMNSIIPGWEYKSHEFLMKEMTELIKMKKVGGSVLYFILLLLAMLAIFDTQVLSIFKRQKEIGTYIAMGMTRKQVVGLFTVEGAMHAILAVIIGAIYGVPFLLWQMKIGISMPAGTDNMGIPIAEKIFPVYGLGLIISTVLLVLIITTIVSYMPAHRISKMNPTDAIKGKIQ
ncbi:MAG: ABC transporter permease [Bacteroidetes bacterium]|nr:MAG: ABC transporter permease [Bacteroidota bacterium]